MKKEQKEICKKIIEYYGHDAQERQLIEEMAELTQALNKFWRFRNGYIDGDRAAIVDNIAEEIADVEICLEQVKEFRNLKKEVKRWTEKKLNREVERIG